MASTWSSLKIELLETGQNPGQWGNLTNINLGDAVLGEAITGQATVDFASDADVTITLTDSATTQAARNLRLNITESSTGVGSVRNLILGSNCQIEKFYLINNTGTGAKTVKNTSGTGITVPAGKATLVFNNGTNVVDAASYFTSLTLGSALPVASGGTGLTAGTSGGVLGYTATGTLASSVALTANALVLGAGAGATPTPMASLGTTTTVLHGNASGAPTFGAVSLTADVTGVLPTANGGTNLGGATPFTSGGVVYASSTSGLATGSALTFDGANLTAVGSLVAQRTGGVSQYARISNTGGTATFISDNQASGAYTGFVFQGLSTASGTAVDYLNLTSTSLYTASGINVGFGTSNPLSRLHIEAGSSQTTYGSSTVSSQGITVVNNNGGNNFPYGIQFGGYPGYTFGGIYGIQTSGNNNTVGDIAIALRNANTDSTFTERMRITSAGDVGIGTSSPNAKLDIVATTNTIRLGRSTSSYATIDSNSDAGSLSLNADAGNIAGGGSMTFNFAGTERARIDSSGNFGIGTNSPSSYGKLVVNGAIYGIGGNALGVGNSDNTNFSYLINSGSSGANNANMTFNMTNKGELMRLTSDGNLGVGTTSPSVNGIDIVKPSTTSTYLRTSDGTYTALFGIAPALGQALVGTTSNHPVGFYTNNTERARITSAGDVQISTSKNDDTTLYVQNGNAGTASTARFDLRDSSSHYLTLRTYGQNATGTTLGVSNAKLSAIFDNSVAAESSGLVIGTSPATPLMFSTYGTERARITSDGNLLVGGTSSVIGKLEVSVTDTSATADGINIRGTQNNAYGGYLSWSDTWSGDAYRGKIAAVLGYRVAGGTGALRFFTAGGGALNEVGRFDQNGNLLVGTTSAGSGATAGKLRVVGNAGISNIYAEQNTAGGYCYSTSATSNGGTYYYVDFRLNDATQTGSITSNGTTTSYNVTSDQRLKENIVDAPDFGSIIDSLQVRSFDWKKNQTHQRAGFIAQELVTVAPEAVHQPTDADEMMAVDYSKLVPMLVKEIQSLRKRLADAGI